MADLFVVVRLAALSKVVSMECGLMIHGAARFCQSPLLQTARIVERFGVSQICQKTLMYPYCGDLKFYAIVTSRNQSMVFYEGSQVQTKYDIVTWV